jgi:beta-lactamase regulating signal transducer with metallopeptidase domain
MQNFFTALLTASFVMSALALFYMALTPFLARRYSEKSRYYVWLIIIIGLIIPFRPQWDVGIVRLEMPGGTAAAPTVQIGNGRPFTMPLPFENAAAPVTEMPPQFESTAPAAIPSLLENAAPASTFPFAGWYQIGAIIWLAGLIIFLTYYAVKHYLFVKMVKRWSAEITDDQTV